jgi:ATP-dependent Clp protease ATP-binding subunit ClpX
MTVTLDSLEKNDLIRVLTEPKDALIKQYQYLFGLDNVNLIFEPNALEAVAEDALKHKTGARGLRSILEKALLDTMYSIPSIEGVGRCIVNADTIRGEKPPVLLNKKGAPIMNRKKKSA